MLNISRQQLPYATDSQALFKPLKDLNGAVFLDSNTSNGANGRYDIISALPLKTFKFDVKSINYHEQVMFLETLEAALNDFKAKANHYDDLPFTGGIIGYFNYDFGQHGIKKTLLNKQDRSLPTSICGLYSWAIIVDHQLRKTEIIVQPQSKTEVLDIVSLITQEIATKKLTKAAKTSFKLTKAFSTDINFAHYRQQFIKIKDYILAGDCYQVNYAQRFSASYEGDTWAAYQTLRGNSSAPYSAFLNLGDNGNILSVSPEQFIQVDQQQITTSPIKGTAPRSSDPIEDQKNAEELTVSEKNCSENLMIVDLLRNDIGKTCRPGSIKVDKLFELHSFKHVHHLISTITGELQDRYSLFDAFYHCFPGGSITGAPKKRAMEIINELEESWRSNYCGSITYFSANNKMDSNIMIRTFACDKTTGTIDCWAGGGIVADSDCEEEYQECLNKVGKLLSCLE